jgi:hypothetical protein
MIGRSSSPRWNRHLCAEDKIRESWAQMIAIAMGQAIMPFNVA